MDTPVLSKAERRKSLSAKKPKKIRNILAQPYQSVWPSLRHEEKCTIIQKQLNEFLPTIKQEKLVPWSRLRKLTKEERLAARNEAKKLKGLDESRKALVGVVNGVNAVTRSLEKKELCSVLLDSKVEPILLIKHIVTMAQSQSIPVILVNFLKTLTLQRLSFATTAIGFKKSLLECPERNFTPLHESLAKYSAELIESKTQSNCTESEDGVESMEICENTEPTEETTKKPQVPMIREPCEIYKTRSSKSERVFIPADMDHQDDAGDPTRGDKDFIQLREDNDFVPVKVTGKELRKSSYVPLKVKRIQGNDKRKKATKLLKK